MNRLTDDKTAAALKENIEKLKAAGIEVDASNERYVRLAELERQTEWISVKDKMPEPLQNVIVCTDINTVTLAWINGYEWCFADQGNGKIERYGFDVVTHWMPLPEPPKEVRE